MSYEKLKQKLLRCAWDYEVLLVQYRAACKDADHVGNLAVEYLMESEAARDLAVRLDVGWIFWSQVEEANGALSELKRSGEGLLKLSQECNSLCDRLKLLSDGPLGKHGGSAKQITKLICELGKMAVGLERRDDHNMKTMRLVDRDARRYDAVEVWRMDVRRVGLLVWE